MTLAPVAPEAEDTRVVDAISRTLRFPRLRYMGSKYQLVPDLAAAFAELGGSTALDAFSGSGVVSYLLKSMGYQVTANDFLTFPGVIAKATVANQGVTLTEREVNRICGKPADGREFIRKTFEGLYYDATDLAFLDTAWSNIDRLSGSRRALAISALVLSAARKQPRGVFTITDRRYDDGRRDLRISMEQHFRERVAEYNAVVFEGEERGLVRTDDVFNIKKRYDLVYLDPPYAPPRDDNDYIKRYHFLEGLSGYWRGMRIMEQTQTKKLEKRYTPFAYRSTITDALTRLFDRFRHSAIVLSYSSNAVPDAETIEGLLRKVKDDVEVRRVDHRYHFGTHSTAERRTVDEYIFIAR